MKVVPDAGVILISLLLPGLLACAVAEPASDGWVWYTGQRSEYQFRVAYPASWTVAADRVATRFRPADENSTASITVLIIDESETPPPPVFVTYQKLRVIEANGRSISVEQRDPAAANEQYMVRLQQGSLVTEFRFTGTAEDGSNNKYKAVFDHIVLSYTLIPQS